MRNTRRNTKFRAAALALMLVAGCSRSPLIVDIRDCPAVAFVKNTNSLTRFAPGAGVDVHEVALEAAINHLVVDCDDKGKDIRTNIGFTIEAAAGPAGGAGPVTLRYFVALVRDGDRLVSKDIYESRFELAGDPPRGAGHEAISLTIPNHELAKKNAYEVLIGFQLEDGEVAYNLRY